MNNDNNIEYLKKKLDEKNKIINLLQNKFVEKTGTNIEIPQNLNKFLDIEDKKMPIKDLNNFEVNKKTNYDFLEKINSLNLPNKISLEKLKKNKNKKNNKTTDHDEKNIDHMVQYIDLSNYYNKNFNKLIFKDFLERIIDIKSLNSINLSNNGINDNYLNEIKLLFSYKNIKKIDLSQNNLSKLTGSFISNSIKETTHLTWLDISRNDFTNDHSIINSIINGLKKHENLFHFGVNYSNKSDIIVDNLLKLITLKSIKSFKIIDTTFSDKNFNVLCNILNKKNNIKAACLKYCFLNQQNINILEKTLSRNRSLVRLDLSNNYIGSYCGIKWIKFLKNNIFLTYLNLSNNKLNDYFCEYLCEVLKENETLSVCDLSYNQITEKSTENFTELLMNSNSSLNDLGELSNTTNIGIMNFIRIKNLLENNKKVLGKIQEKNNEYIICKPFSNNLILNDNEFENIKLWNI